MIKVSVSVLSKLSDLESTIKQLSNTTVDYIHIDVMDGIYVNNTAFSNNEKDIVTNLSNKLLDVHLMVKNPEEDINYFINKKADIITIHKDIDNFYVLAEKIKHAGIKLGIAVSYNDDIKDYSKYLEYADLFLVMSVEEGYGGQEFDQKALDKVRYLIKNRKDNKYLISIDGGINNTNKDACILAGADILVAGSYVTSSENYEKQISLLK
ncbi:MAG TPA: ribulose-phosphate 3-epimerase [Bacilli bacterium]|nr:ribulose-phosphate 3-epimerase [Bacilli bacterium]